MYSCVHGCGYTSGHRGGMNLHEKIHCKKRSMDSNSSIQYKKKEEKCSHEWRFLHTSELRLLSNQGVTDFEEVCSRCQELR